MSNLDIRAFNANHQLFGAANVSAKSVIAVTTGMTGLLLYNPNGSGKDAFLVEAGFVWTTAPAAVHNIGIAVAPPNVTAPSSLTASGSPAASLDGLVSQSGVVKAYDAATVPVAPIAMHWFGGNLYQAASAVGTTIAGYQMVTQLDGKIKLAPGSVACLTVVTTTAVGMGHFSWIEVPAT